MIGAEETFLSLAFFSSRFFSFIYYRPPITTSIRLIGYKSSSIQVIVSNNQILCFQIEES
uniref:Uncharacterized protein n=1 Tax=Uncultured archaeon GZfos26G2 TaxID=3386331 RepID=Q64A69_UNCAG|nr:hypothetical protein GZ33E1_5 [uncultured archaeon GZfos33E1]